MKEKHGQARFLISNTQISGLNFIIDEIKQEIEKNKDQEIILVVPDKFSMNAEQIFMESTGLSSVFNVWITTFSRLVSKIVSDDTQNFKLLTKSSGVMLVSKIILENIDKLSTYKKIASNYSLAETMYNAINLLKSSGVMPSDLKNNFSNTSFGLKLQDLYVVYNEYEKCMKEKIDLITRLQIFDKKIKNSEYINNCKIYFAMFDSFTNVQINSLCNLAKNCKNFCISLCANTHQNNSYIYDNSLFYKLKDYFREFNVDVEIKNINAKLSTFGNFLVNNLFAINNIQKFETDNIKIFESDFIENEVRYVASRIKFLILEKKYCFDDINIAVNGLDDYSNTISKIFNEYDLPFYMDKQRKMTDHFLVKTLLNIAKFICDDDSIINAISITKSPVFEIEYQKKCDFDNYCQKFAIFGADLFKKFLINDSEMQKNAEEVRANIFDDIFKVKRKFESAKNIMEMCNILLEYIQNTLANYENKSQNYDLLQNRINAEAKNKLIDIINDASNMLGDVSMTQEMFFEMLENALQSTNLLTVPTSCNSVFVGDASNSTYYPRKILFVLGATQSKMPSYKTSSGVITDDEIDKFVSSKRISPSIAELNKREKFKLFNLLLLPSDMLEISYSTITAGEVQQKSEFITALQKVITQDNKPLTIQKLETLELQLSDNMQNNFFAYLVGTKQNALRQYKLRDSKIKYVLEKYCRNDFDEIENSYADKLDRFKISNSKEYIFKNNKTSISQIEKYFKCPFMQFITYAIKPQEKEKFEIKANVVGLILHKVAEEFVRYCIKNNFNVDDVDKLSKSIYQKIIQNEEFKSLSSNKFFIHLLEDESVRFCKAIKHQIDCSDFVPTKCEYRFQNYSLKDGLYLSGVVDRIDICQPINTTRIIDYKSGSDKFSFKDIYFGLKLQLIAYLKIICEQFNMTPGGAFYMPVKNKFNDINQSEFKSFKLDGVLLEDVNMIKHHDKNFIDNTSSDILPLKLTNSGEINQITSRNVLNNEQFDEVFAYTFDVINNAISEMIDGYIDPKPYKDNSSSSCDFCPYKALCHFEYNKNGFREISTKDKFSFKK